MKILTLRANQSLSKKKKPRKNQRHLMKPKLSTQRKKLDKGMRNGREQ
jgi:hypothetical protein